MGLDTGSIFRAYIFQIDSIGPTGIDHGYVRCKDNKGILYDFKVRNLDDLEAAEKNPGQWDVVVSCVNYAPCRAKRDLTTNEYGPVGVNANSDISCELISRGVKTPAAVNTTTMMTNNRSAANNTNMLSDRAPTMSLSDPNYDPNDTNARKVRAAAVPGITASPSEGGNIMMGVGGTGLNMSGKSGAVMSADNRTNSNEEENHAGGMLTTSYNFLHHYFIGIANTVALPMPHMVNLIKMIAIGKFVKDTIGTKGKRVDVGNGTTKWQSGTGIFGLADEVADIARK